MAVPINSFKNHELQFIAPITSHVAQAFSSISLGFGARGGLDGLIAEHSLSSPQNPLT